MILDFRLVSLEDSLSVIIKRSNRTIPYAGNFRRNPLGFRSL